ncbi:cupin domain-containing protein [Sphaerisporangium corydalis]|uniref:Cupin domain-containing protein n=1 Tax=Sphaerisporangium corydalis TaxID=1441875 RepID=A0ABV9EHK6_9ACTN|nr:cupin domain-containing protein [Sphaerisporangium corydalis]
MPDKVVRDPVAAEDVAPNRRRGGDIRILLSPKTADSTSGFMGVLTLKAGEYVSEHYHPYSEEFLYVQSGTLAMTVEGAVIDLVAGQAFMVPKNARHRLVNTGTETAFVVFQLGPLAPRPELGHVDTEPLPAADEPIAAVGAPAGKGDG